MSCIATAKVGNFLKSSCWVLTFTLVQMQSLLLCAESHVYNIPISHLNLFNETLYLQSLFSSEGSPSPFPVVSVELQMITIILLSITAVWWLLK